jgi:glycogen debranching enzyme
VISERIRIGDQYYILASAQSQRQQRELLSHGDCFAIFDSAGEIPLAGREAYGLFYRDTRFLDRLELRLKDEFPVFLSSGASDDGTELVTYLTNADERRNGEIVLPRDTIVLQRRKALVKDTLYEQLHLHNYGLETLNFRLSVFFGSDFADMFEVRGSDRPRRGEIAAPMVEGNTVRMVYRGLDDVERQTIMKFHPAPTQLTETVAHYDLSVAPGGEALLDIEVGCKVGADLTSSSSFARALAQVRHERQEYRHGFPELHADHDAFNQWLNRSLVDLTLLCTHLKDGLYAYAGIPWFATIFGRDGLITALEILAFSPDLAAGTLRTLAALQGSTRNAQRDEAPGKILHELRSGEMAATGEVPFARYYGSIDATPLFLVLLAAYAERTADIALVEELWPAAMAAMKWIDTDADIDGDGYAEYMRPVGPGLINQGWKDSHDAISHADGSLAPPPIALAEVQAYIYAARHGMAQLARRLGRSAEASDWDTQAARLRQQFNRDFWMEDQDAFALALSGLKQPCRVVSSNAGQCLFTGIVDGDKAPRLIARLMHDDLFCGWGIRTLSSQARRYNPMSYHNGSVWPHDNALIAAGFAAHGSCQHAGELLTALLDAAQRLDRGRLPELFCGFPRTLHHSPVPYPVACQPQAWAAAGVFLLLQSTFGLSINAWERRVSFDRAAPPPWLKRLDIRGLRVRDARVDLCISRGRFGTASIEIIDKQGDVEVTVRK